MEDTIPMQIVGQHEFEQQLEFVNYTQEKKISELFEDDALTMAGIMAELREQDYWRVGCYESQSTTVEGDHVMVSRMSALGTSFPGLNLTTVSTARQLSRYALVDSQGKGGFCPYINRGGVDYFVPTMDFNCVVPVELINGKYDSVLKHSVTPLNVVKKAVFANKGIDMEKSSSVVKYDFPIRYSGQPTIVAKAERILLGMCYENGIVEFPYDGLCAKLPLERGENLIVGKSEDGEYCIIDVISKRRWLLLSMLAAIAGKQSTGSPFVYGIGSHLFIGNMLLSFLKRTNLRKEAGFKIPFNISEKLKASFEDSLEGCQFEWDAVFGFVKPERLGYRVDKGNFKDFPMQYQVEKQTTKFSSVPTVRIVTVEDLMRHSVDIVEIGLSFTQQLFPKRYKRESLEHQLDFCYLLDQYGHDMKTNYKFLNGILMARRTVDEEFSVSSCGQQFLTNLYLRIWGVENVWVVQVPENVFKEDPNVFVFLEYDNNPILVLTEQEYEKKVFTVENPEALIGKDQAPIYTSCAINDIILMAGINRGIGIIENTYNESYECITMKKLNGCVLVHDDSESRPGRGKLVRASVSGEGKDYCCVLQDSRIRLQDSLVLCQGYYKQRKKW